MGKTEAAVTRKKGRGIAARYRNANMGILILVLIVMIVSLLLILARVIEDSSRNYARFYSEETVEKFRLHISKNLSLMEQIANAPEIVNWLASEENYREKYAAYRRLMDFSGMLNDATLHIVVSDSQNEYFFTETTNFAAFNIPDFLEPGDEENQWYADFIDSNDAYTIAIDREKYTDITRLWINHKIVKNGELLGVMRCGLPIADVQNELLGHLVSTNVRGVIINQYGVIQMTSDGADQWHDVRQIRASTAFTAAVDAYLERVEQDRDTYNESVIVRLSGGLFEYMALKPIADTDWSVITFYNMNFIVDAWQFTVLLAAILSAFVLYIIINRRILRRIVFAPLSRLADSLSAVDEGVSVIFGLEREDELGDLARNIDDMRGRLVAFNAEILRSADALLHKDALMRVVNDVAAILMRSETDEFSVNLLQCMGMMANCVSAGRMYIWKNFETDGALHCACMFEWSSDASAPPLADTPASIPYAEMTSGWLETLSGGICINGIVGDMPPLAWQYLTSRRIRSLLVVPIILRDQFWGFVGFDDCYRERIFSQDEENILRSGSLLIINALLLNEYILDMVRLQKELESAAGEAREANRAKSNFLSNMSHEMRTPMNAIIGMTNIGKSAAGVEKKDNAFTKIENASNHLLGVINDVLDMSKIEANRFELSEAEFDFEKMLQQVVNVINFRIDEKHQHFFIFFDIKIPKVLKGDDQRLAQVIINLLSNAVKFTPDNGNIRLEARLEKMEDDEYIVKVEIIDSGIGISLEQQARLFNSFVQAESTTNRRFGGTGLGLAISKYIIELMGGEIWIESEIGKGATFAFTIRLKRGEEKRDNTFLSDVNWKEIRMLAVDDDLDMLEYLKSIADAYEITCDTAKDTAEAINLIHRNGPYHVCFVNDLMPGMNGIAFSEKIREQGDTNVVIMLSSTSSNTIEDEAHNVGVDHFLQKPILPSSILETIGRCIGFIASEGKTVGRETGFFKGCCILLVEDVEINREIVQSMLEFTGVEIHCAENGVEAVRIFSTDPDRFDMIFMDIQMPEMDGFEATRRIRSLDSAKAREIPIIAMTANVFREDVEMCIQAGMNGHLGKPLNFDEIMARLETALKGAGYPPRQSQ